MKRQTIITILSYVAVFLLGSFITSALFPSQRNPFILQQVVQEDKDKAHEEAIMSNEDQVRCFSDGSWSTLSNDDKLAAVQTIVDLEIIYLGIPHEIPVVVMELSPNTYAEYSSKERAIHINKGFIESEESPYVVLSVICHEIYHAYQFAQVYLYDSTNEVFQGLRIFDEARGYKYELTGFFKDSEGASWWEYKSQTMETNADKYGISSANFYTDYFDE